MVMVSTDEGERHAGESMTGMQRPSRILWWGVALGALVWLWPYASGPFPPLWPNVVAWAAGGTLIALGLGRSRVEGEWVTAWGWLVAASVSSVLAILQYIDWEAPLFPFVTLAVPGFAYANTRQVNHLASLLAVGLLVLMWMQHRGEARRVPMVLGVCFAVALAATASRGGGVQLLLVGLLAACWPSEHKRQLLHWYAVVLVTYVVSVLVLPQLLTHFMQIDSGRDLIERMAVESTCSSRRVLWSNVLELIAQKPLTGWGWGQLKFGHYMTVYESPRFCDMLTNAHNLPLHLATELGVPAAAGLTVGAFAAILWMRPWTETHHSRQLGWGVLLLVGFHSMLEFPVWFGNFQVMVVLALWLVWPSVRLRFGLSGREGTVVTLRTRVASVIVMIVFLAAVSWDYVRVSQLYRDPQDRLSMFQEGTFEKVRHSVFFKDQVLFGQVISSQPDLQNASLILEAALETLHISPEPRVIERVIVSASLVGREDLVAFHVERYRRAWPTQYAAWKAAQRVIATESP
jgi:O-antigen ligase